MFMKIKDSIAEKLLVVFCIVAFIIFLPFFLLYLLFKLLSTPFDYIKYKKSRYQKDFPHKYTWLREPHIDNAPYTAIKENDLPVEYIKWSEVYDIGGYFVYKDILLDFTEPFFFDEEKKLFLCLPDSKDAEEVSYDESDDSQDTELKETNADECLTVDGMKELILGLFRDNAPNRECNRIVFFCSRRNAERDYKEEGLNAMRELDDFIIYEKGELAKVIKDFIENN